MTAQDAGHVIATFMKEYAASKSPDVDGNYWQVMFRSEEPCRWENNGQVYTCPVWLWAKNESFCYGPAGFGELATGPYSFWPFLDSAYPGVNAHEIDVTEPIALRPPNSCVP